MRKTTNSTAAEPYYNKADVKRVGRRQERWKRIYTGSLYKYFLPDGEGRKRKKEKKRFFFF
jgi:hypothetical protein